MNPYDHTYNALVDAVTDHGYKAPSRAGDTRSLPGMKIVIDLVKGFPILTTRKIFYKGVFGELAAFVRGAETLAEFEGFGCNYWHENAANWDPNKGLSESEWRVGKIYGSLWRDFNGVDQLAAVIKSMKDDPYGRRHILTTWDPSQLKDMCLPPCHLICQFYIRENRIHTHIYMRSVDLILGLPSDVILYALLTQLIAKELKLNLGTLTFSFGDCHIYECHVKQWQEVQRERTPFLLPILLLEDDTKVLDFEPKQATLVRYSHGDTIKYTFCA